MLRTHALFSDHMVLQHGRENRIWGWDTPGQVVTLSIEGANVPPARTATAHDGRWHLGCPELPPGGAYRLLLHGSSEKMISDVLCGEVWLAAGQSNMEWPLSEAADAEATIAAASHPHIRLFHIQNAISHRPLDDVTARWQPCTPSAASNFSAVAYHFGCELHATRHMPIGLVEAAWGGTRIEAWTSVEALRAQFDVDAELASYTDESEMLYQPAVLFNALIAPLAGFGMRGVIWYQGESNAQQHASYHQRFVAMIRDWRTQWGEPFPFLFVQLASFLGGPSWPWLREAQAAALTEPDTGMAVAIDIGDPDDIHPPNKREVGRRLSLVARAIVYGEPVQYAGPVLQSHELDAGLLTLRFAHAYGMTTSNAGALRGLEVANTDGVFAPTTARILDNALMIDAPDATAVRYAWHDYVECNLVNGVGLPAAPFRIDIQS